MEADILFLTHIGEIAIRIVGVFYIFFIPTIVSNGTFQIGTTMVFINH